jgi:hypothetical protein
MAIALGTAFARLNAGSSTVKRMFKGSVGIWNADAADWIRRVQANDGAVSTATANAVTDFCNAIDAAGIRDRFYRLGIIAGSNINAALVPLYRGPSLGGTQYGNATDTNDNFVSVDYSESSGLIGNGTDKRLATGLLRSSISSDASIHAGVFVHTRVTDTFRTYIGYTTDGGPYGTQQIQSRSPATQVIAIGNDAGSVGNTTNVAHADGDLIIGCISGVGAGLIRLYKNGSPVSTGSGLDTSSSTIQYGVFAAYRNDTAQFVNHANARIGGYTIGLNLTDSESAAYAAIWDTFLTALGRR